MIELRQAELDILFHKYDAPVTVPSHVIDHGGWTPTDQELCERIARSKQGEKWKKLFEGHFDDYGSPSEADLALCGILAFWCGKDPVQMDRIFRQSKLYRPKWDEKHDQQNTYGQMTIQKAIDGTDRTYEMKIPTEEKADFQKFKLVQAGKIEMKPIQWLIHNFMEADSLSMLFGDPGCGKSFLAIAVALSVSTGTAFYGRDVQRGPVVYIAGEGHNGLKRRMMAWSISTDVSHDNAPLFVSLMPAALTDADMIKQVKNAIELVSAEHGPPVLIVIDTLARNFGPGDENSNQDMSRFVQAADAIRNVSRATVLIVHHSGHGEKGRARGAMALKAALDAEFRLDKDEAGIIRMEATKMKDAKFPDPCAFRLRPVPLNICNSDGETEFSAVLEESSYCPPPQKGKSGQGKHQIAAMEILKNLIIEKREEYRQEGRDPATARISMDDWKKAMKDEDVPAKRIPEVTRTLLSLGTITEEGGYVSLL